MDKERYELLEKIAATEFCALDLNLYLDNHPEDEKALNDYNELHKYLHSLIVKYTDKYGPLLNFGFTPSKYPWQWVEDPWPWEIDY